MSRIKYTVDVNEYICSALEQIRKMHETRDYSSLLAVTERIQHHADMMEKSIGDAFEGKYSIRRMLKKEDMTPEEFMKKVKELAVFSKPQAEWEDYE